MAFGPFVGFKISANAIKSINFGFRPPDPAGPEQLISDAVWGRLRRRRDVFVKLAYPELRDFLVQNAADKRGFTLRDLDPALNDDRPVHVYEMPTHEW